VSDPAIFDDHVSAWLTYLETPWARVRYTVVASVLDRHIRELTDGSRPLRILDLGGGDGSDSVRLASAGHEVTIVDYSEAMLELAVQRARESGAQDRLRVVSGSVEQLARRGTSEPGFDLALCHFVIQYVDEPADVVAAVAQAVRPGGLVSLIAPNPASDVLAKAVRDVDPATAMHMLDAATARTETFEHDVARIGVDQGRELLEAAGCSVVGRYGCRAVIDLIADDVAKRDPERYAAIERLELAVCDRSPYRDVARAWQLVARKELPDDESVEHGIVVSGRR
jgi:S-adenosylmethionine-dependent methyltransferase